MNNLRAFDRFSAGRRVASLAALGVLALRDDAVSQCWREFRNTAVHYADPASLQSKLLELSEAVQKIRPELGRSFTGALTPDILQAGGSLPELARMAAAIVESFSEGRRDDFGAWFDIVIDEISHGRHVGEVTTPRTLARLMARIADPVAGDTILDPACGLGATLIEMSACADDLKLFGQEVSALAAALATLRLYLLRLAAEVSLGDALRAPAHWADGTETFDRVICDPPYGLSMHLQNRDVLTNRFEGLPTSRSEAFFVEHCLQSLKPGGRAVLLLPLGFLVRRGGEANYRSRLIEAGRVEGVIALPGGVIPWTELPTAILVLRGHDMPGAPITLIDAGYLRQVGKRATERLTDEQVAELAALYRGPSDEARAVRVLPQQLLDRDADLQPQHWLKPHDEADVDPADIFNRAVDAESRAAAAKAELDRLMVYFRLRSS
jgi:type I restriction-modification system DNA methylase subunit